MKDKQLSIEEAAELDGFGELFGFQLLGILPIHPRAKELWEREILYGSDAAKPLSFDGLLPFAREVM